MEAEAVSAASLPPSNTIYLNNLNDRVKKAALRKSLYAVFSPFGAVLEIVACKTNKCRGQAWIAFADVAAASNALRQLQGFPFFDKPMRIAYAKSKSDAVSRAEGVAVTKRRRPGASATVEGAGAPAAKRVARVPASSDGPTPIADASGFSGSAGAIALPAASAAPGRTLLVTGLSTDGSVTDPMLRTLFGTYPGLVDVRSVAGRGFAFVEYTSEAASAPALQGLHNFQLTPTTRLSIAYAPA